MAATLDSQELYKKRLRIRLFKLLIKAAKLNPNFDKIPFDRNNQFSYRNIFKYFHLFTYLCQTWTIRLIEDPSFISEIMTEELQDFRKSLAEFFKTTNITFMSIEEWDAELKRRGPIYHPQPNIYDSPEAAVAIILKEPSLVNTENKHQIQTLLVELNKFISVLVKLNPILANLRSILAHKIKIIEIYDPEEDCLLQIKKYVNQNANKSFIVNALALFGSVILPEFHININSDYRNLISMYESILDDLFEFIDNFDLIQDAAKQRSDQVIEGIRGKNDEFFRAIYLLNGQANSFPSLSLDKGRQLIEHFVNIQNVVLNSRDPFRLLLSDEAIRPILKDICGFDDLTTERVLRFF